MGAHIREYEHCNDKSVDAPIIVPPTWNKTTYHRALSDVWGRAAQELSDTENLFIVGYSLPESDVFFRYLFALGTIGETPLRRAWVFNPDTSPEIRERYSSLFGPGAEQRFKFFPVNFIDAIDEIRGVFQTIIRN